MREVNRIERNFTPDVAAYLSDKGNYEEPIFTAENIFVWQAILSRIEDQLQKDNILHPEYVSGFHHLQLTTKKPPSLARVNELLSSIGWQAVFVRGMVPHQLYLELQAKRIFPIARNIRKMRDLEHSAAPDFLHDMVGHLPMLFSEGYRNLILAWAQQALVAQPTAEDEIASAALMSLINEKEKDTPNATSIHYKTEALHRAYARCAALPNSRYARFSRYYTWAIEYGIIRSEDKTCVIGAAALSSPGEMNHIMTGKTLLCPFDEGALETPVDYTLVQGTLFYVPGFAEYFQLLKSI